MHSIVILNSCFAIEMLTDQVLESLSDTVLDDSIVNVTMDCIAAEDGSVPVAVLTINSAHVSPNHAASMFALLTNNTYSITAVSVPSTLCRLYWLQKDTKCAELYLSLKLSLCPLQLVEIKRASTASSALMQPAAKGVLPIALRSPTIVVLSA